MTRALARVALQLWIVLFILVFGAELIHLEPSLRVITQLLFGLPLAVWAAWRVRGPQDRLDWAVLLLLLVYALVCLASRDRAESLGTLALVAAYAAWFLILRREGDRRGPIVLAIATGLALTLAFNAYLLIREKVDWYAAVGGAPFEGLITFPWESVNALPVLVLVAIPFVAWLEPSRLRTSLGAVVGLSALVVVPISLGRAGWLGLAVAGVIVIAVHPAVGRRMMRFRPRQRALLGAAMAAGAVAVAVLIGPRLMNAIGESGRLLLWEQASNMIASAPLLGSGPGIYSWARLEFAPASADLLAVRLTHSVPLQTLIDGGVVMLACVLVVGAIWALTAVRREGSAGARVALACVAGFVAAITLDDFSYLPAITASMLATAAFVTPVEASSRTRPVRWLSPLVLAVIALVALPSVVAVDTARSAAQSARTAMVDGAYGSAADAFEVATLAHPENGGYWLGLGMAAAYAGDTERAVDAYERAVEAAPGDPRGYGALAELDRNGDRIGLLREAARRTLGDPQYAVRLGVALAVDGQADEATDAWARAVALRPELIRALPYADAGFSLEAVAARAASMIRAEPRPAAVADAIALWELGLAVDELPSDAGTAWRAVDAARHGDTAQATDLADTAIAEAAYEARGYQAAAAVAAYACDPEAERAALARERIARGAVAERAPEPSIRREFVYREASLGPTQPPNIGLGAEIERWPWSLIERPSCSQ